MGGQAAKGVLVVRLMSDGCAPPPPPSKEEKGFLACCLILFLIKRESWGVGRRDGLSVWRVYHRGSELAGRSPDPGKGQASSHGLWRVTPAPPATLRQHEGFGFSTLMPTVSLINSGLVTTASVPSRHTGTGL